MSCEPQTYVHGTKLRNKAAADPALAPTLAAYETWRTASLAVPCRSSDEVRELVRLLNVYKDAAEPVFDARANSAQEVLQPSILEEFFEYLFCKLDDSLDKTLLRRPASGFIDLAFNPRSLNELVTKPDYTVRRKDHDFVIGSMVEMELRVPGQLQTQVDRLVVPAVAIECKRYLERNMLDECSGTAEKIKKATPYCLYFVVAEFLKMDDAAPELSRIDEIYVLRKQRNSERQAQGVERKPIDAELVVDIYNEVERHLTRIWWNPESALTSGKAFNFAR